MNIEKCDRIANTIMDNGFNDLSVEDLNLVINHCKEILNNREAGYTIPSMIITKDDLKTRFEGKVDEKETSTDIDLIPPEDMKWIAYRMSDKMMKNYWDALEEAYEDLKEHKIHEEQKNG